VLFGLDRTQSDKIEKMPLVALKFLEKKAMSAEDVRVLQEEINVHKRVNELGLPFCLKMIEWFELSTQYVIVMEHMSGGELLNRLRADGVAPFPDVEVQAITKQVLTALDHLHRNNICHRDIKPENILLTHDQFEVRKPVQCMLADFGIAAHIDSKNVMMCFRDLGDLRCSPGYGAPEVINKLPYGRPVDMWSLGVVLYMLLTGVTPFIGKDEGETRRKMAAGVFPPAPLEKCSADAADLVRRMLEIDPAKRITADEALKHPFITSLEDLPPPKNSFLFYDKMIWRKFAFFKVIWATVVCMALLRLQQHWYGVYCGVRKVYTLVFVRCLLWCLLWCS
jgi:calcium/calmodulin-dependent protein kinase I